MRTTIRRLVWVGISILAAACGDPNTSDARGYTKAPLEDPGVVIKAEKATAMDSLGSPILPRDTLITAENVAQPAAAQPKR